MLTERGFAAESHNGALLAEPWTVRTKQDGPYKVFTPFWNAIRERTPERPTPAPAEPARRIGEIGRPQGLERCCQRGPIGRAACVRPGARASTAPSHSSRASLKTALKTYDRDRDCPALPHTSRMSPYLHWGELSPRQVWHGIAAGAQSQGLSIHDGPVGTYLRELGWREFTHHLLYHWPSLPEQPWREEFGALSLAGG